MEDVCAGEAVTNRTVAEAVGDVFSAKLFFGDQLQFFFEGRFNSPTEGNGHSEGVMKVVVRTNRPVRVGLKLRHDRVVT